MYCHLLLGEMRGHLLATGVAKSLTSLVATRDNLADVRDQVTRLTSMLDSG